MGWIFDVKQNVWKFRNGKFIPKQESVPYVPSPEILEYIKQAEGWHQGWQDDGKGNLTTGWGFKQTPALKKQFPKGMNQAQADEYFTNTAVPERVSRISVLTPNWEYLNQNQRDALFDAFYNVGEGTYTKGSPKMQEALKNLNHEEVVRQMDWDYNDSAVPGARKRRDYERELYRKSVTPTDQKTPTVRQVIQQQKTPEKSWWQIVTGSKAGN